MPDAVADHDGVGAELLAEGHRHGVLVLGAAHFQDVGELCGLGVERGLEFAQRGEVSRRVSMTPSLMAVG